MYWLAIVLSVAACSPIDHRPDDCSPLAVFSNRMADKGFDVAEFRVSDNARFVVELWTRGQDYIVTERDAYHNVCIRQTGKLSKPHGRAL